LLPVHAVVLVALHWTQALSTQAGAAAVGHAFCAPLPKSPVQEVHPPLTQTGRPAGQSEDVLHAWQATSRVPSGALHWPPWLTTPPFHSHGLKLVSAPHGLVSSSCMHVPSEELGTDVPPTRRVP
jgi:hypothetical protein